MSSEPIPEVARLEAELQASESTIGEVALYARKLTLSQDPDLRMVGADILDIIAMLNPKA